VIATAVALLAALTALVCAVLLLRAWARTRLPLLLWSGLCFVGLTLSNGILVSDLLLGSAMDLFFWRNLTAFIAMALLLYGLIWKTD
jgi:hypothetical protein